MMSNPRSRKHPAATLPTSGACGSSGDTIGWLRLIPRLEHAFGALGGSVGQRPPARTRRLKVSSWIGLLEMGHGRRSMTACGSI